MDLPRDRAAAMQSAKVGGAQVRVAFHPRAFDPTGDASADLGIDQHSVNDNQRVRAMTAAIGISETRGSPPAFPAWARLPTRILGLRREAIFETLVFLLLAVAIDAIFLDGTRFRTVDPHPFWAIVLLVTVQYGANEGLLAAALSSVALLSGHIPVQTMGEDLHGWLLRVALLPILWCGTAFWLGQFSKRHLADRDRLAGELAVANVDAEALANSVLALTDAKSGLEERVAGAQQTLATVVEGARAIQRGTRAEVVVGADSLVPAVLGARRFSLFLATEQGLVAAKSGLGATADGDRRPPPTYTTQSAFYRAVVEERRTLAVVRPADGPLLAEEGLLAGPLIAPGSGEVLGALRIDELGFADLTAKALLDFDVVCAWIGEALASARQREAQAATLVAAMSEMQAAQ